MELNYSTWLCQGRLLKWRTIMGRYSEYYDARDKISNIVREDLIGPVMDDEIIDELPIQYYVMGKLYPKDSTCQTEGPERTTVFENESYVQDSTLASTNMKNPSAMGITFTIKHKIEKLKINVTGAFYNKISEADVALLSKDNQNKGENKKSEKYWKRDSFNISFELSTNRNEKINVQRESYLRLFVHRIYDNGEKVITIVLTNECVSSGTDRDLISENTLFQPSIIVKGLEDEPIFTSVRRQVELTNDEELTELDMLYSDYKCYAQGHGCSVEWDMEHSEPTYIASAFMPRYELMQMQASKIKSNPAFNMHYLYTGNYHSIIANLHEFLCGYKKWINDQKAKIEINLESSFRKTAERNLEKCCRTYNRITHTIELLEKSGENGYEWLSFRYANEAMYWQRKQTIIKKNEIPEDDNINWYPFQLAFILQEIADFIEPDSKERDLVDLLWFPTGGGKTEAYLGIAAFCIFYRRFTKGEHCNGVTAIMRYTLRLLTIQQFERASTMICACELLRKKYNIPGKEITIGLWVGNGLTPSKIAEADSTLQKIKMGVSLSADEADPCQIKVCPWCGKKLTSADYHIDRVKNRMIIKCSNSECNFHENSGLPISMIDAMSFR